MRGEETLCLGLAASGLLGPRSTLLNLGSHWKLIRLDAETRIESSVTSLSGELIHATQTQTILAGSVPGSRPEVIDPDWMRFGMAEQRRSGTARALFCVRLLEQRSTSTPEERLAYLIGVYIAADLDAMLGRGLMVPGESIVIAGGEALAAAWATALAEHSIGARLLSDGEIEQGLLAGLRAIAASAIRFEDLKQEME
jgi:2-keto-3-deoxy-galactonokinase